MQQCRICGISIGSTPIYHPTDDDRVRKIYKDWCLHCRNASPAEYWDIANQCTSIPYLIKLAAHRKGKAQSETYDKIVKIIQVRPGINTDAMIIAFNDKCSRCGEGELRQVTVTQYMHYIKSMAKLCYQCHHLDKMYLAYGFNHS